MCVAIFTLAVSSASFTQGKEPSSKVTSLSEYGVSKEYPFGRMHPNAPKETAQFDFMVGDFDRKERTRNQDGTWKEWVTGEWNARYVMNGHAILDESFNSWSQVSTSNMRVFDDRKKKWVVTWFKMPGYGTTVAEGEKVDDTIIFKNGTDRYIFYNLSENGYDWVLKKNINGQMVDVWQISCKRKK